jgi:hypothetical protein
VAIAKLSSLPADFQEEALNALANLYAGAAETIKRRAEQRLLRDATRLTVEASRQRALLIEVELVLQELDVEAARLISEMIPPAYRQGVKGTTEGLRKIGFSPTPVAFNTKFHGDALQLLMLDMQDTLLEATVGMRKSVRLALRRTQLRANLDRAVTKNIAEGVISRSTTRQLSRDIARTILDDFGNKPLTINGRQYDIKKYAKLVARTKTREAVTAGTINRMVEMGEDLVMVTAHGSKDGCGFYEGRVYSVSGGSGKYPSISELPNGGPPFHPNCRHNLSPFIEPLATGAEKRFAKTTDERALGKKYADVEKLAKDSPPTTPRRAF